VLLLIPHVALVGSSRDPYATSLSKALGNIALIGLIVLAVWRSRRGSGPPGGPDRCSGWRAPPTSAG
jgi:hypothetical protein